MRYKGTFKTKAQKPKRSKEIKDTPLAPEATEGQPPAPRPFRAEPMILVQPPNEADAPCQRELGPYNKCGHTKAMHYGGAKGHCNTSGCVCLEFSE